MQASPVPWAPASVAVVGSGGRWRGCPTGCSAVVVRGACERRGNREEDKGGKVPARGAPARAAESSPAGAQAHGKRGRLIRIKTAFVHSA